MDQKPFRLTKLDIQQMPGLPRGLEPYEDISPQINIIAGPNASGKSSTARAIQKVIWQDETKGLRASADAELDGDRWKIRIDSASKLVQKEGVNEQLTGIPAPEAKNRYMLALHRLIEADEGDLAGEIIKESIGGYDLEEVAEDLDYSDNAKTKRSSEYRTFEEANSDKKEKEQEQSKLKAKENQLAKLQNKKEEAEQAEKKKQFYQKVLAYLQAKQKYEHTEEVYQNFPDVLDNVHGEVLNRIENIEEEIALAEQAMEEANNEIEEHQHELNELNIPDEGIDSKDLTVLEERVEQIRNIEEEIGRVESEIEKFRQHKEEAVKSINSEMDSTEWNSLDLDDITGLEQFLKEAHQVASMERFLEKEIGELETEKEQGIPERSVLSKGIDILAQWLKEPKAEVSKFPEWVQKAVIGFALLGSVGSYFSWIVAVAVFVVIIGLVLFGLYKSKEGDSGSERIRIQDYESTELEAPENWNVEDVQQRLSVLVDSLQEASWQERIENEIDKRESQLDELKPRKQEIMDSAEDLKQRISALPDLPWADPKNYTALAYFIKNAIDWQQADSEFNAQNKKKEKLAGNLTEQIEACNKLFEAYNFSPAENGAEAKARFKSLKDEEGTRQKKVERISDREKTIKEKEELKGRKTEQLQEIYDKLEIPRGQKDEVRNLLGQRENFQEAQKEYNIADRQLSEKKLEMQEHSLYEQEQDDIEGKSLDQVQDILKESEEKSADLDQIKEDIATINAEVNSVKSGDDLEQALKRRDEALENLYQLYESNVSSVAGRLLVDKLKNRIKDQNRPAVFNRAKELFNRITKGKYEIQVDERDEPEFIAYDTVDNIGKKLDELSTGTRIQLLLSIRVAYVETHETNIKLPLLADELLANSDDRRAKAIIEALTEISKEGRQIFYFTAQGDEVNKWASYLSDIQEVDYKVFNIQEGVNPNAFTGSGEVEFESFSLVEDVPAPHGESYEDYRDKVEISEYDLLKDQSSKLHLWYLMDDKNVLYHCLNKGIEKWGRMKSYLDHDGDIEGLSEEKISEFKSKVRLLNHFQELYQQGRSKPIDRSVLESTSAVTDTFIDEVAEKLKELNGNPVDLLEALRNSEVSGFRNNKLEELENSLLEAGFIDEREALDLEEIRSRIHAYISNSDLTLEHANSFLNRIINDQGI